MRLSRDLPFPTHKRPPLILATEAAGFPARVDSDRDGLIYLSRLIRRTRNYLGETFKSRDFENSESLPSLCLTSLVLICFGFLAVNMESWGWYPYDHQACPLYSPPLRISSSLADLRARPRGQNILYVFSPSTSPIFRPQTQR